VRRTLCLAMTLAALTGAARAAGPAPSWIVPDLLEGARAEGSLTVYSSINEDEALPLWQEFETATGIKVNYIRGNDAALTSKIMIEARSQQSSWDALITTSITRLPPALRARLDPPQASALASNFRDPEGRWFAVYANYNAPSYNSSKITLTSPPKTFEEFLSHKEWIGHVGIEASEFPWYRAVLDHYGADKGGALMKTFFDVFKPTPIDGHLALARAIGAGEYWITPSNYVNLANNVRSSGAPVDYWGMDPLSVILGAVAVNARAPHPKAAALATNFLLSREGQTAVARKGRLPVRADATPVPPDAITKLGTLKPMTLDFSPEQERDWQKRYQDLLRAH
jgi:iron(III) transport system substrate-binding protein